MERLGNCLRPAVRAARLNSPWIATVRRQVDDFEALSRELRLAAHDDTELMLQRVRDALAVAREARGLDTAALAARCGVQIHAIEDLKSGTGAPTLRLASTIAVALGLTIEVVP